ncbi:MAG: FtsW/RodA/SpoVE family cell cycle protein [Coriobacteriales bacterium]|jgi:rod shape determining protein RodA
MATAQHIQRTVTDSAEKQGVSRGNRLMTLLIVVTTVLVLFGLVIVWSVTRDSTEHSIMRQFLGVGLGVVMLLIFWKIDYSSLAGAVIPLMIIDVVLLLSPHLPVIGYSAGGATSWVNIGIRFQPGELAKIVTILLMAAVVARYQGRIDSPREYAKCIGTLLVPFLCIMTQPDLGTGLVLLVIGASIMFVGGANRRLLLLTILILVALVALVFILDPIFDKVVGSDVFFKDYQKNRILVFLNPDLDPTGAGYNLTQAKIAIGSGGLVGKGLGNATQSALGFLPEAPTDFVFCTIAEQLGFLGVLFLLAMYGALFYVVIRMMGSIPSLYSKLALVGVCGMWLFQILENIGMCCGLMPITGIPLPFISYGSSFMMVNFACIGLILSMYSRRGQSVEMDESALR